MLRAAFGEGGKLDELEMMFDGVAVHQQLQRAMGVRACANLDKKAGGERRNEFLFIFYFP